MTSCSWTPSHSVRLPPTLCPATPSPSTCPKQPTGQLWASVLIANPAKYCHNLFLAPLITIETLTQVQWHPSLPTLQNPNQKRLHGDFADIVALIYKQGGIFIFLKGHLTHFLHTFLFDYLQPATEEFANEALDIFEEVF